MVYYDRIDLSEGIDVAKNNNSKECMVCQHWFLMMGLNFKISFVMVVMISSTTTILTI